VADASGEAEGEAVGGFGGNDSDEGFVFFGGDGVGGVAGFYRCGGIEDGGEEPVGGLRWTTVPFVPDTTS